MSDKIQEIIDRLNDLAEYLGDTCSGNETRDIRYNLEQELSKSKDTGMGVYKEFMSGFQDEGKVSFKMKFAQEEDKLILESGCKILMKIIKINKIDLSGVEFDDEDRLLIDLITKAIKEEDAAKETD